MNRLLVSLLSAGTLNSCGLGQSDAEKCADEDFATKNVETCQVKVDDKIVDDGKVDDRKVDDRKVDDRKVDDRKDAETPPTGIAFYFFIDNTLETYVKCGLNGDKIACDGNRQSIPRITKFTAFANFGSSGIAKMAARENGCFTEEAANESVVVERIGGHDTCYFEGRFYKGDVAKGPPSSTIAQPKGSLVDPPISIQLPFLEKFSLKLINARDGSRCTQTARFRWKNRDIEMPFDVDGGTLTFSSLFSIGATQETRSRKTAPKDADLVFSFQPAVDVSALEAAGVTTESLASHFAPHLGDYVMLEIKDGHGHRAYCKAPDALEGSITIPADIIGKFSGSTSLKISRYKLTRLPMTDSSELVTLLRVGMYSSGNDVQGRTSGGSVNVWIE